MTTASALLLRARDPAAGGGRIALVEQAAPLVQTGLERCHLAVAYAQLGDRELAARCLADAAAHAGEVRVARNAARIHRTLLGDADAGKRALAACAAQLLHRDATVDEWRLLAAGWHEARDRDAALHYLAHAASAAATVDELCAVAVGYSDAGDPAAGHAAAARARGAAGSVLAWTTIARAYDALADVDGVIASLGAAEAAIASPADAAAMAHAWVFHGGGGDDEVDRCFARGVELAATEEDGELLYAAWMRLSRPRRAPDLPLPIYALRPPPPRAPAELLPRRARSFEWPYGPARLLDRLRGRMDGARLRRIASHGNSEAAGAIHAVLEDIARTGRFPHPLPWEAAEALSSERWTEDRQGTLDHTGRAFACTILCLDGAGPAMLREGNEPTLAVLLESCIALGEEAVDDLVALLAAMAGAYGETPMRLFAELALVLAQSWLDASDPRLPPAAAFLVHDEEQLAPMSAAAGRSDDWLLRLTFYHLRHHLWRSLARSILTPPAAEMEQLAQLLGAAP